MKSALVFLALVAFSQAGVPLSRDLLGGRVINGEDVKEGEIPYQVSLQLRKINYHFCGGSVLNKNYVLTAAHCVDELFASDIQVIAGSVKLSEPQSVHLATKIIRHKQYDESKSYSNDIALIKVGVPFVQSKTVQYVTLPEPGQLVPANAVAILSGWGSTVEGGKTPDKLQRTELRISEQDYCNKVYTALGYPIYYKAHICANNPEVFTGACHGDSGGPLTVDGKVVGLASFTIGCGSREVPTVYTRVSEYIDWINANLV